MNEINAELEINTEGTAAKILVETISHKRQTQFNNGLGHHTPYPTFVVVFTFDTTKKTTCILKEYAQGTNEIVRLIEENIKSNNNMDDKHDNYKNNNYKFIIMFCFNNNNNNNSPLDSAKHELSEEARLKNGEWICLLPEEQKDGISELKWGRNRFVPYLCINPEHDDQPKQRDLEECIQVVKDVQIADLKRFITKGEMMLPSVQTSWMALEYLSSQNLL
ncbi:unnamed protein product [Cunninghamella blakesleeana]